MHFTRLTQILLLLVVLALPCMAQINQRKEIALPDIPGYLTLKTDLHMHTVFSDGNVWPTIRVKEAWLDGLDAIALTDHVESQPHKKDLSTDLNRPHEIATGSASSSDLLLIRAGEITRDMPPGHFNALFLTDVNALKKDDWRESMKAAIDQGAFVFWNHPGWTGQQPDGIARWYDEHTELYEKGWLKGIEIVNYDEYYPLVHTWCLEKKLTLLGNSDIHDSIQMGYDFVAGKHRPITLVFARERTVDSIKEAMLARRTAVYFENRIFGQADYLEPLFRESIRIKHPSITVMGKGRAYFQITNQSDLDFALELDGEVEGLSLSREVVLYAHRTALLSMRALEAATLKEREVALPYKVKNLHPAPDEGLCTKIVLHVTQEE
ncbi:MAG: Sb-PDE family phosphodiesterase [Planctomycetota bacterium]